MGQTAAKILSVLTFAGCAIAGCYQEPQHAHPPTPADLEAWRGELSSQLATQRQLMALHREVQQQPDGSEIWRLTTPTCKGDDCCVHQFVIRDARIASYETKGECVVGCGTWPKEKLFDCLDRVRAESK